MLGNTEEPDVTLSVIYFKEMSFCVKTIPSRLLVNIHLTELIYQPEDHGISTHFAATHFAMSFSKY